MSDFFHYDKRHWLILKLPDCLFDPSSTSTTLLHFDRLHNLNTRIQRVTSVFSHKNPHFLPWPPSAMLKCSMRADNVSYFNCAAYFKQQMVSTTQTWAEVRNLRRKSIPITLGGTCLVAFWRRQCGHKKTCYDWLNYETKKFQMFVGDEKQTKVISLHMGRRSFTWGGRWALFAKNCVKMTLAEGDRWVQRERQRSLLTRAREVHWPDSVVKTKNIPRARARDSGISKIQDRDRVQQFKMK